MKTSKLLRFISALVCLALIITMNPAPSLALELDESVSSMGSPISTRTVTDRDEAFPLDMQPVIDHSTVSYTPSEVPEGLLASELTTVDVSALKVGLRISLKDTVNIQGRYTLTICKDDTMVLKGQYDADDIVTIDTLTYNESYTISVETETADQYIDYMGDFFYGVDVGNVVFISMEYKVFETSKTSALTVTSNQEIESNNTQDLANPFYGMTSYTGTISSSSDLDWYCVNGVTADRDYAYAYVKNQSSSSISYVIYFHESSGSFLALKSGTIAANGSLAQKCNISSYGLGAFYIRLSSSASNVSYKISLDAVASPTWYSQLTGVAGSYTYWNTEKLVQTKFTQASPSLFICDPSIAEDEATSSLMGLSGCAIASMAMVLHNLGKVTTSNVTDFRTGVSGNLGADPYTVFLRNNGITTPTYTFDGTHYNYTGSVSVSANWATVASAFGATYSGKKNFSYTTDQKIREDIAALLDKYPQGIILYLKRSETDGHYLVATGYTTDSNDTITNIRVCDPFTRDPSKGNNVLIANSYSFTRKDAYTWSQIDAYRYFY